MQSDRTHKHTGGNVNNRVNVIKIKSLHRNIELSDHDAMHVAGVFMVANMQCINLVMSHDMTFVACMQNPSKRLG